MRIFAYVSSMRKECSVTLEIINEIIDKLREICVVEESYIATPEKDWIELCNGCMGCLNSGKCVNDVQDQMEKLKKKMLSADLIILATPVYLHNVNAPMKNFLDRLNLWCYTILMVTHSVKAASRANRVLFIKDGELNHQIKRAVGMSDAEMNAEIISHMAENEMIG